MVGDARVAARCRTLRFTTKHFEAKAGNDSDENLITLCVRCHDHIHKGIEVRDLSTHKIQVHRIVLTQANKRLFLRWALRGFRLRDLNEVKASEKR